MELTIKIEIECDFTNQSSVQSLEYLVSRTLDTRPLIGLVGGGLKIVGVTEVSLENLNDEDVGE